MVRVLRNIVLLVGVLLATTSCFKKVTTDTTLRIKVLEEAASGGERVSAEGCYGYIYYVNKDWTVASYEDAAAKTITNSLTGEKFSEPDGESEPYVIEGSTNNFMSIFQGERQALVVVVYPAKQMYAYLHRWSEAENLSYTYLTLIFHTWKTGVYNEGSKDGYKWTVVAPEAVTPDEPTIDEPTTDEPTDE